MNRYLDGACALKYPRIPDDNIDKTMMTTICMNVPMMMNVNTTVLINFVIVIASYLYRNATVLVIECWLPPVIEIIVLVSIFHCGLNSWEHFVHELVHFGKRVLFYALRVFRDDFALRIDCEYTVLRDPTSFVRLHIGRSITETGVEWIPTRREKTPDVLQTPNLELLRVPCHHFAEQRFGKRIRGAHYWSLRHGLVALFQ